LCANNSSKHAKSVSKALFILRLSFSKVYQHAIMDKKLYKRLEYNYKKSIKAYLQNCVLGQNNLGRVGKNGARLEQILEYLKKNLNIPIKTKYDIIQTSINFTMLCMTSKC
jgi:hypothetical protein